MNDRSPALPSRRQSHRPLAWWRRLVGQGGPHRGRRLLALVAAIAVPAMAAPGEWRDLGALDASPSAETAMPFETPGQSFPGSAFFYLEDLPPVTTAQLGVTDEPLAGASTPDDPNDPLAAARAFYAGGTGLD